MRPETYTGACGRLLFVDALGRCLRFFDPPAARRAVNIHEQMMRFVAWVREEGFAERDHDNLMLDKDVLDAYRRWADENGIERIDDMTVLNRFEGLPGVDRVRTRKLSKSWAIRIKGKAKAMAYRVATAEELAERAREIKPTRARSRPATAVADATRMAA